MDASDSSAFARRYSLLSEKLKMQGYHTHMIGKWHIGDISRRSWPKNRGFDSSFGFHASGLSDHFTYSGNNGAIAASCGSYTDLIFDDVMPNNGDLTSAPAVDEASSTWPGTQYVQNGASMTSELKATYSSDDADSLLQLERTRYTFARSASRLQEVEDGSDSTNWIMKEIEMRTVATIENTPIDEPFFAFVSTPAMRTSGTANDAQRKRAYDSAGTKFENCDHFDPDHQGSRLSGTSMDALRNLVSSTSEWNSIKALFDTNTCSESAKQTRFLTHAYAATVDDVINSTVSALYRTGKWDKTLIIWTADNGGWPSGQVVNWPLRGTASRELKHSPGNFCSALLLWPRCAHRRKEFILGRRSSRSHGYWRWLSTRGPSWQDLQCPHVKHGLVADAVVARRSRPVLRPTRRPFHVRWIGVFSKTSGRSQHGTLMEQDHRGRASRRRVRKRTPPIHVRPPDPLLNAFAEFDACALIRCFDVKQFSLWPAR